METTSEADILLVEDDTADAEMTMRALRRHNVANKIHWVKDGQEALDYMLDGTLLPKLVLLDLKMPKVDGLEVLGALKASARTRAIPVVVMTSSNEEKDVVASYNLGANSYIVKPVEFQAFVEVVSSMGLYWILTNRVPHERGKP